jgi:hypothetical protein
MTQPPPFDLARLPTLTEVVNFDEVAVTPDAGVVSAAVEELEHIEPTVPAQPDMLAVEAKSNESVVHGREFFLMAGAVNQFRASDPLIAAKEGAQLPTSQPKNEPGSMSQDSSAPAASEQLLSPAQYMPDWIKKVVTDAVDEAMAEAMVYLLPHITKHVQKRLEEAAKNPPLKP